jgi:hypothetical protein
MTDHGTAPERPRTEDHLVFLLLAAPIFAVTVAIVVIILTFTPR